jgi:hypothetical protein
LAAYGPNGLEIPSPNVVVDRPATDLQNLGGAVDGNGFHDSHISGKGSQHRHAMRELLSASEGIPWS